MRPQELRSCPRRRLAGGSSVRSADREAGGFHPEHGQFQRMASASLIGASIQAGTLPSRMGDQTVFTCSRCLAGQASVRRALAHSSRRSARRSVRSSATMAITVLPYLLETATAPDRRCGGTRDPDPRLPRFVSTPPSASPPPPPPSARPAALRLRWPGPAEDCYASAMQLSHPRWQVCCPSANCSSHSATSASFGSGSQQVQMPNRW